MKTITYEKLAIVELDNLVKKYSKLSYDEITMLLTVMGHKMLEGI